MSEDRQPYMGQIHAECDCPNPTECMTKCKASDFPRLRRWTWLAYFAVIHWPLSVKQHGIGKVYWALLPYAGEWAYHPDGEGA